MDPSSIGSTAARFLHVRFRQAPNPGPGSSPRTGKNFLTGLAELPVGSGIGRGGSSFREDRLEGKIAVTTGSDRLRSPARGGPRGNLRNIPKGIDQFLNVCAYLTPFGLWVTFRAKFTDFAQPESCSCRPHSKLTSGESDALRVNLGKPFPVSPAFGSPGR